MNTNNIAANDIAIIGMACRFPGADNPTTYWRNLRDGKEALSTFSDEQLKEAGVSLDLINNANYVKAGMILNNMEMFDAGFFGLSPLDAKVMDPQHRHFLECAWEAFEDAGHDPEKFDGAIGVFAGSGHNAYMPYNLLTNPELLNDIGFFLLRHTGNDKDFLATRASYCFNLRGPSLNIQTACSTSLVATHTGVQSLLNGECDMVLVGGSTIELPHRQGYLCKENEISSPDGHCRPFEAASKGTVFSSGVGAIILRRLADAIADGDHIHAIIKSSAVNNDGANKVSYLAPSVDGQAAAVREALTLGDIEPQTVTFIECHGTGTQLGDPIEVAALTQAYGVESDSPQNIRPAYFSSPNIPKQWCAIGSVKSNIGHTDTAAGVASLIKVVQSLKHKQLPPTLHYKNANPAIDFANSPFYVNAELRDWQSEGPRRAGVSSLGVGGTNAHMILQEAPSLATGQQAARAQQLILLSARSDKSLLRATTQLADYLTERTSPEYAAPEHAVLELADVAFTLAAGRRGFTKRRFAIASTTGELIEVLDNADPEKLFTAEAPKETKEIVFMFAGGGAQYASMGQALYAAEPVYRSAVDQCVVLLAQFIDYDLKSLLYPSEQNIAQAKLELERPSRTLPALFTTQYAQAQLWLSWGVEPKALIGHSMGENTAACLAGVLSLKDALGLVALRGKLFETIAAGGMLSVELDESELQHYLSSTAGGDVGQRELDIAAINAPGLAVASGPVAALEKLEQTLKAQEIGCQRVHINIAAHSSMLEPILKSFGDYLRSVQLNSPQIPFISNVTGTWISEEQATDPEYWVQHLRNTVRFADGVGILLAANKYLLLEVGPGRTLASMASMHSARNPHQALQTSMRHPSEIKNDLTYMLTALGQIWQGNGRINWQTFYGEGRRRRVSLPTYCFDHARHWVEPGESSIAATGGLVRREAVQEYFSQPVWHRTSLLTARNNFVGSNNSQAIQLLIFAGETPLSNRLVEKLSRLNTYQHVSVVWVREGKQFAQLNEHEYSLRLNNSDDYIHLISDLARSHRIPNRILHTLALDVAADQGKTSSLDITSLRANRYKVFDSLLYLAQALGGEDISSAIQITVLTTHLQQVAGEELSHPLQSLVLGPVRVIPREFPAYQCCVIDLPTPQLSDEWLLDQLSAEISSPILNSEEHIVAYRGKARYTLSYQCQKQQSEKQALDLANAQPCHKIKTGGVYLITGGLGDLGLVAAEKLAQTAKVKLILLSRRGLAKREYWSTLIEQQAPETKILQQLLAIEASGSEILFQQGDVADIDTLRQLKITVEEKFGQLNGILHTAGVIDDALIQLKEIDDVLQVLRPKVDGTLAINAVFPIEELDFCVLYSSTSAFMGIAGQVDYAAANAFLDAFAHYQAGIGNTHVVSVNWPAWRDVGMAANIATGSTLVKQAAGRPVDHPLLDRCILESADQTIYSTLFTVEDYWLLSEHRIKDSACLIPGSGFIEIARAAFCEACGVGPVVIERVIFHLPFVVGEQEKKELRIQLKHSIANDGSDVADFIIVSDDKDDLLEHVTGTIKRGTPLMAQVDTATLSTRCQLHSKEFLGPAPHPHLNFGPRWGCLQKLSFGEGEAVLTLQIALEYQAEFDQFRLHPALLDIATAGAQELITDYDEQNDFYVPVGYGRLHFRGHLPTELFSHIVLKSRDMKSTDLNLAADKQQIPTSQGNNSYSHEVARFDVDLYDAQGNVLVSIADFTMQRVADRGAIARAATVSEIDPTLKRTLELGISNAEGTNALGFILNQGLGPQTVVSVYDLHVLTNELVKPMGQSRTQEVGKAQQHNPDADADIPQIETALLQHPAVKAVVVRCHLDDDGSRRLIAHFIADDNEPLTVSELRKFAKANLGPGFIPQHFVELYELPVNELGEIDRTLLLDPFAPANRYIAPRTSTEKQLAKIWQEVLGVERISLTDNFFDIGGHSLVSIRVIVRVDKKFGVRLDQGKMVMLTLEQLAKDIEGQRPDLKENIRDDFNGNMAGDMMAGQRQSVA